MLRCAQSTKSNVPPVSEVHAARALYESHWNALSGALAEHMPDGCTWTEPSGGMFTWLRMPEGIDAIELPPAATAGGVAYVPGAPFYVDGEGANEMRLSFSALDEAQLAEAARRLAGVVETAALAGVRLQ